MNQSILAILNTSIEGINIHKFWNTETVETLVISLQEGHIFPDHKSLKNALLLVLDGQIEFNQSESITSLGTFDHIEIVKNVIHSVKAITDTRFLIIR